MPSLSPIAYHYYTIFALLPLIYKDELSTLLDPAILSLLY
jgi:hypothetical protein